MKNLLLLLALLLPLWGFAAKNTDKWLIQAIPDHANFRYKCGEKATFRIKVMKNGQQCKEGKLVVSMYREDLYYTFGRIARSFDLKSVPEPEISWSLETPGFMGIFIMFTTPEKKHITYRAAVAFDPQKIQPGAA